MTADMTLTTAIAFCTLKFVPGQQKNESEEGGGSTRV